MRHFALAAIAAYKRWLSPHKGFSCAYRMLTGRASCSTLGYRAIRRYGIVAGIALLRRRTRLCGVAHRRSLTAHHHTHIAQRGFCDPGCDLPCDVDLALPKSNTCNMFSEFLNCCSCDIGRTSSSRKKDRGTEKYVYIPPNTRLKSEPRNQA